jgi:hypothetical protein
MSFFSKITGQDARRNRAAQRSTDQWGAGNDPGDQLRKATLAEQQGGGWEDAFNKTAGAYVQGQLPQLRNSLQMSREDAIRRGISTGDLQTTNEGDITSAWGKNISNTLGGMAMQGYENSRNRYLDLLTGQMDRDQNSKNQNQNMWLSILSGGIKGVASAYGAGAGGGGGY